MQSLAPHEPSVNLVPVLHARLTELPAVEDIAPIDLSAKIHESRVHPFADDAEVVELGDVAFDVGREALRFDLKELRNCIRPLGARPNRGELELTDLVFPPPVITHEILDNLADKRQSAIGFLDGEDLFHGTYCDWLDGAGQVEVRSGK